MSNPAPTINQINAFNATQGTTIDFNIIGGTELVRSNRIYIYDLSDNSLICTHLYVSTESIHELPPNTDSSIVYESGKSSADFVNGAQYYAQIQTYTDTAGTEGGSGLSVAKMFWCLVNPTLTITTIPSTISTTSYNVSATYNANTSVVSNIIQQYQFSLYSATGSLLQSSGVVVGSGTQQGTSTAYDISYNFTGLSVGSSYYVVVDVTTTQGMGVSAQSGTFTVSIDTPTLGEATVVNNACDGYISVTSNLSGEYGGSASGEIATFETDSVNDVSSLKVTLTPQQDDTPWIGTTHDTAPYLHRAMPTQSNAYNRESGVIIGGTVAWNQLRSETNETDTKDGITTSYTNGKFSITNDSRTSNYISGSSRNIIYGTAIAGHKYVVFGNSAKSIVGVGVNYIDSSSSIQFAEINSVFAVSSVQALNKVFYLRVNRNYDFTTTHPIGDVTEFTLNLVDLTQAFGSTIADYIYSLEQATAGAGVAWFRKYFPEDYYPYSANTLQSVQATAHKTYDSGGNVIGNYALDSSLTLRGIPKLDASNNLYYDGDVLEPSGRLTRKYGIVTVSVSEVYVRQSNPDFDFAIFGVTDLWKYPIGMIGTNNITYALSKGFDSTDISTGQLLIYSTPNKKLAIAIPKGTTLAQAKAMFDGAEIVYELATPTTETADPFTSPQIVDPDGTEEYVTANYVPVGHDSTYSLVCPISGHDEVSANVVGKNLLPVSCQSTLRHGITYTVYKNDSGAVTRIHAEGTSTAAHSYTFVGGHNADNPFRIKAGSYWLKALSDGRSGSFDFNIRKLGQTQDIVQVTNKVPLVLDEDTDFQSCYLYVYAGKTLNTDIYPMVWSQSETSDAYEPYQGQTYTADLPQTVYGGTVDLVSGELVIDRAITLVTGTSSLAKDSDQAGYHRFYMAKNDIEKRIDYRGHIIANACPTVNNYANFGTFDGEMAVTAYSITSNPSNYLYIISKSLSTVAEVQAQFADEPLQVVYRLATPTVIQLTPQEIKTLVGQNNVWSEQGDVELSYHIPITNLLVKRQDIDDVSGVWLTLYSQPVTQASDMDFTFIDFTNQYGKTYKYALVPLLNQTQSGVVVQIEGGYTVSDNVDSIFDGVYIADQTNVERVKAGVGYGNIDMNQGVGSITPIGSKYPIVITNSQNQYHNGSIRGTIVPNDFYSNGNLSRIDMVNKRDELEQFLTNKRAKIIKDWNGKMWLVMIMSNVACSFDDNYGMGMVSFSADWLEVGDPTNQQDLYNAGLINVGGV